MKLVQSILTKNPCYTAGRKITVKGLMLHSVGCSQPKASVFINSWNSASYWRCSGGAKTNCGIKGIREPELMEITAQVMGTPEFDGDAFRERVDHITMVESGKLEYTFLDGHTQEAEYSTEKPSHPWSDEQRAKFMESTKDIYTPERRKAMSEHMKKVRSEKHWASKRK